MTDKFDTAISKAETEVAEVALLEEKVQHAGSQIKAIRATWDLGILDMNEGSVMRLERDYLFVVDALQCAKDSAGAASKEVGLMIRTGSELHAAIKLEYKEDASDSLEQQDAIGAKVDLRVAESRCYREVARGFMKKLHIPTLAEK